MAKKNNAKSAGGGNAAAKTEKKGKNQISQQQARANAARASAKISPAPEGPVPAISVLVPICNSEQYLEQALDSLIAQTFTDFEALCIRRWQYRWFSGHHQALHGKRPAFSPD